MWLSNKRPAAVNLPADSIALSIFDSRMLSELSFNAGFGSVLLVNMISSDCPPLRRREDARVTAAILSLDL